ncbi:MAG: oligosaccharide flippase family protein [Bacteroidota bacterium]
MPLKIPDWINTSIWKHILTLISGSGVAQVITLLSLPILTRLYQPEEFGILAVFLAALAVMTVAINGGYDMALMLPEKDEEARKILLLCIQIALVGSLVWSLLSAIFSQYFLILLAIERMTPWHHVLAGSLLLEGLSQPLRIYLSRLQKYRTIALSKILRSSFQAVVSIGLGIKGYLFEGLILGFLIGQFCGLVPLGLSYIRGEKITAENTASVRALARKYKDFPKFALIANWLNNASRYLPFFFIPVLFSELGSGEEINGWFQKADQVLTLPIVLISMSIGTVFFERGAKAFQTGIAPLKELTRQTLFQLILLGLPFLLSIMIFAPELFSWVLGEEWEEAGRYARWLMPWFYLIFITTPLSWLVDIRRKLKIMLWISILFFLFRGGIFILWEESDVQLLIQSYGLMNVFLVLGQLLYYLHLGGITLLSSPNTEK